MFDVVFLCVFACAFGDGLVQLALNGGHFGFGYGRFAHDAIGLNFPLAGAADGMCQ